LRSPERQFASSEFRWELHETVLPSVLRHFPSLAILPAMRRDGGRYTSSFALLYTRVHTAEGFCARFLAPLRPLRPRRAILLKLVKAVSGLSNRAHPPIQPLTPLKPETSMFPCFYLFPPCFCCRFQKTATFFFFFKKEELVSRGIINLAAVVKVKLVGL